MSTELRQIYTQANQTHLLDHLDSLPQPSELYDSFLSQLTSLDVQRVNKIVSLALAHDAAPISEGGVVSPPPAESYDSVLTASQEQRDKWHDTGLKAVAAGEVAVILLAGGQGTRLGSSDPKGCYDIKLPSRSSLFRLQAERIRKLQYLAEGKGKAKVTWFIMTSKPTRLPTEQYFEKHEYFGLEKENVLFFEQGTLPCIDNDGKIIISAEGEISSAPDGNGGIYAALRTPFHPRSSDCVLSTLRSRNIQYVHAFGVDNSLVRVADPVFMGYCISRQASVGVKVVRKVDPLESVGVVAQKGGKFTVLEYSEIPAEMATKTDSSGQLAFRFANVVQHFYTSTFLQQVHSLEEKMPFHVARKKIPFFGKTGSIEKPTSPNGIKLELFIFDVFPLVSNLAILEVSRQEEFSPLKNAPGAGTDCPETSRADVLQQSIRWLKAAGASKINGEVEIGPLASFSGEGLDFVNGRQVAAGYASCRADLEELLS